MISSGFELVVVGEEGPPLEPVEEQPKQMAKTSGQMKIGASTCDNEIDRKFI